VPVLFELKVDPNLHINLAMDNQNGDEARREFDNEGRRLTQRRLLLENLSNRSANLTRDLGGLARSAARHAQDLRVRADTAADAAERVRAEFQEISALEATLEAEPEGGEAAALPRDREGVHAQMGIVHAQRQILGDSAMQSDKFALDLDRAARTAGRDAEELQVSAANAADASERIRHELQAITALEAAHLEAERARGEPQEVAHQEAEPAEGEPHD